MPKKIFPKYTGHYVDVTDVMIKEVNGKPKVFVKVTDDWYKWIPRNKWFRAIECKMYHHFTVEIKDEWGELKEFQLCVRDVGKIDEAMWRYNYNEASNP